MQFEIEYTDTFGGEANYLWVRRATIEAALGLTGLRCRRSDLGETLALYPVGMCTVLFVTPVY